MLRRLLVTVAAAVAAGGALVSCGDSADSGEALRWRTAVDVPVNFSMKVDWDSLKSFMPPLPDIDCELLLMAYPNMLPENTGCEDYTQEELLPFLPPELLPEMPDSGYLVDLGSGTVPTTSDVMDILRKLDSARIGYHVEVINKTQISFTVYGMLFPKNDTAGRMEDTAYYTLVRSPDDTIGGRVNIFRHAGMHLGPGDTTSVDSEWWEEELLSDLVIGRPASKVRPKAFSYRWLVVLETGDLGKAGGVTDTVDIKLRMRFSGVNSVDSLFSL